MTTRTQRTALAHVEAVYSQLEREKAEFLRLLRDGLSFDQADHRLRRAESRAGASRPQGVAEACPAGSTKGLA